MKSRCSKLPTYQIAFNHEVKDEVYFMYMNGVRKAYITHVIIRKDKRGVEIWYVIDKNTCGDVHVKTFRESELFRTKTDLLESL